MALFSWRGRRINRVPACRDCGFDLSGVLPNGVTCPECGAGLRRPKAVRNGQRRRIWFGIGVGATMVLVSGAFLGFGFFVTTTNGDMATYKPLTMLALELRHGGQATVDAAAGELRRRVESGTMNAKDRAWAIALALDVQGDRTSPWSTDLGDMVEQAPPSLVSTEQRQRYLSQSLDVRITGRPQVRAGATVPVLIEFIDTRCGSQTATDTHVKVSSASIAGRAITEAATGQIPVEPSNTTWDSTISITGAASEGSSRTRQQWQRQGLEHVAGTGSIYLGVLQQAGGVLELVMPHGVPAGDHELAITLALEHECPNTAALYGGMSWSNVPAPGPGSFGWAMRGELFERTISVRVPVRIVDDATTVRLVAETPDLSEAMQQSIQVKAMSVIPAFNRGERHIVRFAIEVTDPPRPVAFDLYILHDGVEENIGTLVSERSWHMPVLRATDGTDALAPSAATSVRWLFDRFSSDAATLILRPNSRLAERTIGIDHIFGGTLEMDIAEKLKEEAESEEDHSANVPIWRP